MANRTFGWIQNPSSTDTLKNILALFVAGSEFHNYMVTERLPLLASAGLFSNPGLYLQFQKLLRSKRPIPYEALKGQGAGGGNRAGAKCSGLAQAAVTGQQTREYTVDGTVISIKKPYTDDWTADGFLRWAISLGFLDYNYDDDTCSITEAGRSLVRAGSQAEINSILGKAYLSYPPACRVLGLLCANGHMTKFEIGCRLGFTDEAGFTSFPQNIWVQAYEECEDAEEKRKLRSDTEGSSDKYARMICGWLEKIGWVRRTPKTVHETIGLKSYDCVITSAFEITEEGRLNYTEALGNPPVPKIVYREMLASKAPDADYLRNRRALILLYLMDHAPRTMGEILKFLSDKGIEETETVISDDMKGLVNIGLNIASDGSHYVLADTIEKLTMYKGGVVKEITEAVEIKDRVRVRLQNIDHKYLALIDYAFSGKESCLDFEIYTIDLLVNELDFNGLHLGGTRKPDGIFYYDKNGVIIDNKAYSKGFTITRHMADEMVRYVQENNDRNPDRNPNQWWLNFDGTVNHFNFVFISSLFKGDIEHMLDNIRQSTGVEGSVITAENLLYYADAIKGGDIGKSDFLNLLGIGKEVVYP